MHILVGFAPGGPADIVARLMGQWLSERLGQPFIIEDHRDRGGRPRAPNGYTLLAAVSTNTLNPALYPNLNFNFTRDIAMVAGLTRSPLVLEVNPAIPVSSVPELIAYVKAHRGKISLACFGTGTTSHVAGVLLRTETGMQMTHVRYRGGAPMVIDLLCGQVQSAFDNLHSSVPTLGDFVPAYEVNAWEGIVALRATPVEVIAKLNKEINAGLTSPKIAARIADLASSPFIASPAELDKLVIQYTEKWGKVIRSAHVKLE